jgi:[acyl-carrier-protein] S-malonyltransferase
MSKIAWIFPGQGSQAIGMGKALAAVSPEAANVFETADRIAGRSISGLCFRGPQSELAKTINAQPAIFTADCACLAALRAKGVPLPDMVAGHSLGEYAALLAANVLDFGPGLELVILRAEAMHAAVQATPGKMIAVIGLDTALVKETAANYQAQGVLQVANYNCPGQVTLAGEVCLVEQAKQDIEQAGGIVTDLNVAGAFHSVLMEPALAHFAPVLQRADFRDATVPIILNVTAQPVTQAETIRQALVQQITSSVHWEQSIERAVAEGVDTFIEIGPGKVLRKLVQRCIRSARFLNVEDAPSLSATLETLEYQAEVA